MALKVPPNQIILGFIHRTGLEMKGFINTDQGAGRGSPDSGNCVWERTERRTGCHGMGRWHLGGFQPAPGTEIIIIIILKYCKFLPQRDGNSENGLGKDCSHCNGNGAPQSFSHPSPIPFMGYLGKRKSSRFPKNPPCLHFVVNSPCSFF